jgi:hypothetical protein
MKAIKTLTAGLLAIASIHVASADVTVYVTGSTAFRAATSNGIKNIMTGVTYAYDGTSFTGANHQIIKGTLSGVTGVTTFKTNWSGSVAGIRDVTQGNSIAFFGDSTAVSSGGTNDTNAADLSDSHAPDIAMADNYQAATRFTSPALTDNKVGVVPFAWVASKDAPAAMTNLVPQLARAVFKVGFASAAMFTNNNADAVDQSGGTWVYAIGRDPFSGTRVTATAESGVGIFTVLAQYNPTTISSNTITQINLTSADNTQSPPVVAGDNGYSSGGTLADQMRYSSTSVDDANNDPVSLGGTPRKICFVTYLGENDSYRAVNGLGSSVTGTNSGNAHYLTYNGVAGFGGVQATLTCNTSSTTNPTVLTVTSGTTAGMVAGQAIKAGGPIPADTVIQSVDTTTQITMTKSATSTTTGTAVTINNLLPNNIRSGTYSFWGYEHIMWLTSLTGDKLTAGNSLKTQISTVDYFASGLADDTAMRVKRTSDGGTIAGKYY